MTSRTGFVALFAADIVSALGNRMSMVAIPWLVLVTTSSPAKAGVVAAAQLVPYLAAGIFAAPLADRFGLRATSVVTDLGSALAMAAIAAVPHGGFGALVTFVAVAGALRGVGDRAKHVLLRPLAEGAGLRLIRVTSAYEGLSRAAMLVGAPLAGVLIYLAGPRSTLWVDAATFLVSAVLVAALVRESGDGGPRREPGATEPYLAALRAGVAQLWRDRLLFTMLMMIFVANLFGGAGTAVLIPVWVAEVLHSPAALGTVLGAFAAGAVLGSVAFTAVAPRLPTVPTFLLANLVSVAPPLLILLTGELVLVLVVTFVAGLAAACLNPILGAMQYERIPPHLQTRVFGLATALCFAGLPLGGLLGGWAVTALGLDRAILVGGVLALVLTGASLAARSQPAPVSPEAAASPGRDRDRVARPG